MNQCVDQQGDREHSRADPNWLLSETLTGRNQE
jgi:hypothetical protein